MQKHSTKKHIDDVSKYVDQQLDHIDVNEVQKEQIKRMIVEKSEGLFLYARMVTDAIKSGMIHVISVDGEVAIDRIPGNLQRAIEVYFHHAFPNIKEYQTDYRMLFSVLCASPESVPFKVLRKILGWSNAQLNDALLRIKQFTVQDMQKETVRIAYQSFDTWLRDRNASGFFYCGTEDGFDALAGLFTRNYETGIYAKISPYFYRQFQYILNHSEEYRDELDNVLDNADFIYEAGDVLYRDADLYASNQLMQESMQRFQRKKNQGGKIACCWILLRLGLNYLNQERNEKAYSYFEQCEKEYGDTLRLQKELAGYVYANHAWLCKEMGRLDEADRLIQTAFEYTKDAGDDEEMNQSLAETYYDYGTILYKHYTDTLKTDPGKADELWRQCNDALNTAIKLWNDFPQRGHEDDDTLLISMAKMTQAWLFVKKGDLERGYQMFYETLCDRKNLRTYNQQNNYVARSLRNIAKVCLLLAEKKEEEKTKYLQEADNCCEEAIMICRKIYKTDGDGVASIADLLTIRGEAQEKIGNANHAVKLYREAYEQYSIIEEKYKEKIAYLGNKLIELGKQR